MNDSILTLHPEGKQGVSIGRHKYEIVRHAILESIRCNGEVTFTELMQAVRHELVGSFYGSIPWYVTTVKLDLEARHEIERIPQSRPPRMRLTQS
jgi:uncharacterized protein DUF6958